MLNFLGRMAAEVWAAQGQSQPADPLAPPQNGSDPRIAVARRGYRSNCWLWQDDATADAARRRVWQERHRRSPEQLVSQCGHPRCVRQTHLAGFSQREYQLLTRIQGHIERAAGDRDGVARAAASIKTLSRARDIGHKDWAALLNVSLSDFEAGLAQGERQQQEPAPADTPATAPVASEPAPLSGGSLPPPPPPPPPLPPDGPLGNPTNLEARPGESPGSVVLAWTPAANATVQRIGYRLDGADGFGEVNQPLPGNLGVANLPELPVGRWHFIVIAGQQGLDDAMTWSEWSNWATITVP